MNSINRNHNNSDNKNNNNNNNHKKYCTNCGNYGHLYKSCNYPVLSLGVISFKYDIKTNNILVLLIQRKDSYSYMDIIRGKYNLKHMNQLYDLIKGMTYKEVSKILNNDFDYLWKKLWNINDINNLQSRFKREYKLSKEKFNTLKLGYFLYNKFYCFKNIVQDINKFFNETEYGLPKGRRNYKESDFNCAVREYSEETNYKKSDLIILDKELTLNEIFRGTNKILYEHKYYIALCTNTEKPYIDISNKEQVNEVKNIKWCSLDEACYLIRPTDIKKKEVIRTAYKYFINILKERKKLIN